MRPCNSISPLLRWKVKGSRTDQQHDIPEEGARRRKVRRAGGFRAYM